MLRSSLVTNFLAVPVLVAGFAGCGKPGAERDFEIPTGSSTSTKTPEKLDQSAPEIKNVQEVYAEGGEDEKAKAPAKPPAGKPVERKIIYTADVQIMVTDFDEARQQLDGLIEQHKAYVADSDISGEPGLPRRATWTIRVPVGEFKAFHAALLKFGYPQRDSLSSEDITDRFYDVERRVANAQAAEKRLLQLLDKRTNELKDVLALEDKLRAVRGEIESMQGRLRLWRSLTALTTVNLTFVENKNFTPPQEPTFANRIGRTFDSSLNVLRDFGKGVVLFFVALAPWLPVIAVVVVPLLWAVRRRRRHAQATEVRDFTP